MIFLLASVVLTHWLSIIVAGAGLATDVFEIEHDQGVIDPLEISLVAARRKPATNRAPWRKIDRQRATQTARSHPLDDAFDDLARRPGVRPTCASRNRQAKSDHALFPIRQVGLVPITVKAC
jgi:hypothetical protein